MGNVMIHLYLRNFLVGMGERGFGFGVVPEFKNMAWEALDS